MKPASEKEKLITVLAGPRAKQQRIVRRCHLQLPPVRHSCQNYFDGRPRPDDTAAWPARRRTKKGKAGGRTTDRLASLEVGSRVGVAVASGRNRCHFLFLDSKRRPAGR